MKKAVCIISLSFMLMGCYTSEGVLKRLSLNMKQEQVVKRIGPPKSVRSAVTDSAGQAIEIWEYDLSTRQRGEFLRDVVYSVGTVGIAAPRLIEKNTEEVQSYWLYFCNGTLVQWGLAGAQPGPWKLSAKAPAE